MLHMYIIQSHNFFLVYSLISMWHEKKKEIKVNTGLWLQVLAWVFISAKARAGSLLSSNKR